MTPQSEKGSDAGLGARLRFRLPFWAKNPLLYSRLLILKCRLLARRVFFRPLQEHPIPFNSDFGNHERDNPGTNYLTPDTCTESLQNAINTSGFDNLVLRGAGHSQNGLTLARRSGVAKLCLLTQQKSPLFDLKSTSNGVTVTTSARVAWHQLENYLNGNGLCVPVLTDVLETSVGGTLSVGGGYGVRSIRFGAQFSGIQHIRFLDPQGAERLIDTSLPGPAESRLVGRFGRDGIITEVCLKVVPLRPRVVRYSCLYRSLSEQLAHLHRLLGDPCFTGLVDRCSLRFRAFNASLFHSSFAFELDPLKKSAYSAIEDRLAPHVCKKRRWNAIDLTLTQMHKVQRLVRTMPPLRVWCDFLFDDLGAIESFLTHVFRSCYVDVAYGIPIRANVDNSQRFSSTPLFRAGAPGGKFSFGIGIYRFFSDPRAADKAREEVGELCTVAQQLNGRPYLYGAFPEWVLQRRLQESSQPSRGGCC